MKINIKKIDERIARLQELRRIATDPELTALLSEFAAADSDISEPVRRPVVDPEPVPVSVPEPVEAAKAVEDADGSHNGRSLWGINRR
jgi:hypothetical protein